ncbi:hypothetical protein ACQYWQ_29510 [Streptomyces sp. P6-2-1]|uniref:hypothetical protein n=1 Tax=Streptomyces sp. P6-2-1 TaxID=3422591 RepID=UPI003D361509
MSEAVPSALRPALPAATGALLAPHTRARTACRRAGGLPVTTPEPAEAYQERRAAWARAVRAPDRRLLCAERGGELLGPLSAASVDLSRTRDERAECWRRGKATSAHPVSTPATGGARTGGAGPAPAAPPTCA